MLITVARILFLYVPLAYLGSWLFGINGIFAAACFANFAVGIGAYIWHQKNFCLNNLTDVKQLVTEQ